MHAGGEEAAGLTKKKKKKKKCQAVAAASAAVFYVSRPRRVFMLLCRVSVCTQGGGKEIDTLNLDEVYYFFREAFIYILDLTSNDCL